MNPSPNDKKDKSEETVVELKYQKTLTLPLIKIGLVAYSCFSIYFYVVGVYFESLIFFGMTITTAVSWFLAYRIRDIRQLTLLKRVGGFISFFLLATAIVSGLFTNYFYIAFPWVFLFPMAAAIFVGGYAGIFATALYCLFMALIILNLNFPELTATDVRYLRYHSSLALIALMLVAAVSERSRVRVRNYLLKARNQYRQAEALQRDTNSELKREIDMRLESESALAQSEHRYRALFEESMVSLLEEDWSAVKARLDEMVQQDGPDLEAYFHKNPSEVERLMALIRIKAVNRAALELYEASSMPALVSNIRSVLPRDTQVYMQSRFCDLYRQGRYDVQITAQALSGRRLHLLVGCTIPVGYEQSWEKVFTSIYDITERVDMEEEKKRVERRLQEAGKVQSIASLASGIAHQFNNVLTAILGNLDLLEIGPQEPDMKKRYLRSLRSHADRLGGLTKQLLAYAAGGKYQAQNISINDLVRNLIRTTKICRKPDIRITTRFEKDVHLTDSDPTQISSALEAVLINAVEAMPDGGEVVISTRSELIAQRPKDADNLLSPGTYAVITITDHGSGMDEETRQRVMEPFFSTKFLGRGLGMAAADGIVRNHNGLIEIDSAIGQGTRVVIYLPG